MSDEPKPLSDEDLDSILAPWIATEGPLAHLPPNALLAAAHEEIPRLVAEVRRLRALPLAANLSTALAFERAAERQAEAAIVELERLRAIVTAHHSAILGDFCAECGERFTD